MSRYGVRHTSMNATTHILTIVISIMLAASICILAACLVLGVSYYATATVMLCFFTICPSLCCMACHVCVGIV